MIRILAFLIGAALVLAGCQGNYLETVSDQYGNRLSVLRSETLFQGPIVVEIGQFNSSGVFNPIAVGTGETLLQSVFRGAAASALGAALMRPDIHNQTTTSTGGSGGGFGTGSSGGVGTGGSGSGSGAGQGGGSSTSGGALNVINTSTANPVTNAISRARGGRGGNAVSQGSSATSQTGSATATASPNVSGAGSATSTSSPTATSSPTVSGAGSASVTATGGAASNRGDCQGNCQ